MANTAALFKPGELHPIVKKLKALFDDHQEVLDKYNEAIANVQDFPNDPPLQPEKNIWRDRTSQDFCYYFNNWYDSEDYKEILKFRLNAAKCDTILIKGKS